MKKSILTLLALAAMLGAASAGEHKVPKEKPLVTVNFPEGWKVEDSDESLDATSNDDEIYLNIEGTDTESVEGAIQESMGYLKKNKVKMKADSMKKTEAKLNDMDVVDLSFDGEDADGPCKISLTIISVTKEKGVILLYWASVDGEKKHQAELTSIMKSIKAAK